MATEATRKTDPQSKARATALRHALSIEEKKRLQARVADLVIDAYDLPSSKTADPACPAAADVTLFRECLRLFQPSDLNDLIQERNIDNRCGYALCPRPNQRLAGGGDKVWNQKVGKDFKIVNRSEMERWCSKACGNRTAFIGAQLSSEPSWLRERQNDVQLLDEVGSIDDLAAATKALSITVEDRDVADRLQALSLERGEDEIRDVSGQVEIVEKSDDTKQPTLPSRSSGQQVEGHRPRKVRFMPSDASAHHERSEES